MKRLRARRAVRWSNAAHARSGCKLSGVLGVIVAGSAFGCSAPYKCDAKDDSSAAYDAPGVESQPVMGTQRLADDDVADVRLRATLTGLPRLWQGSSNIRSGSARYRISVEYEDEPKGNDGKTEMPRVAARLSLWGSLDEEVEIVSTRFQQGELGNSLYAFRTCRSEDEPNCCRYGAETCSLLLDLSLERVDAAPFPPVVVSWSSEASAQVSPCPLESEAQAELTLEQEER
jgi:hypothetical protein